MKLEMSKIDSDERNFDFMKSRGWTFLTDWTFTSIFPLQSMLREAEELKRYYGKSYNVFMLTFGDDKGHLDLWGKLEEDYSI